MHEAVAVEDEERLDRPGDQARGARDVSGLLVRLQATPGAAPRRSGGVRRSFASRSATLVAQYARALTVEDGSARVRAWTDAVIAVDACRSGV